MKLSILLSCAMGIASFGLPGSSLQAKTLKIGTMIPKGNEYANYLEEMAKKVKEKTDGRVKFKFYFGGLAGDEPDVLRKIHVGQLHGGVFTAKAMSDIYSDVRLLEVPFTFNSRQAARKGMEALSPEFSKGFTAKGYRLLGLYETGEVYMVSKNKIPNMAGLQGQKIWLMEGDKLAEAFTKSLNLVAVPVALPDVLTSLSTGLIDVAYAPALAIIALQWHSKINYIVEQPFGFHFQGFLLKGKWWDKMKPSDKKVVEDLAKVYARKISDTNLSQANAAFDAIKKQGAKPVAWPESDVKGLMSARNKILESLTGGLLSKKSILSLESSLK